MAMTHVVLKEFYLDRQCEYFTQYAKTFTDLPFCGAQAEGRRVYFGAVLEGVDLGHDVNNCDWKTVYFDSLSRGFVVPNGSIGFRWNEEGRWNLKAEDSVTGSAVEPLLSYGEDNDGWVSVQFPFFDLQGSRLKAGSVPIKKVKAKDGRNLRYHGLRSYGSESWNRQRARLGMCQEIMTTLCRTPPRGKRR